MYYTCNSKSSLPILYLFLDSLVVTGVSRSGRVRKKSSKLLGYESGAEEIDRPRKKLDTSGNESYFLLPDKFSSSKVIFFFEQLIIHNGLSHRFHPETLTSNMAIMR